MFSKFGMNFEWSTNFHSESARSYSAPFGKTQSEMGYTSQVLEVVKNAENDIFSLFSTIIQLNIFKESHPVATV